MWRRRNQTGSVTPAGATISGAVGRVALPTRSCSRHYLLLLAALICVMTLGCRTTRPPFGGAPPPVRGGMIGGPVHTFSIVGFDPETGDLGVAVESKFFGVGSVVPWAKAKIGAIATQSYANVAYGPDGLELLRSGKSAQEAIKQLTSPDEGRERRQLGVVDASGSAAAFTGEKCNGWAGHYVGSNFCVQGNLLVGEGVINAMRSAFENACGDRDSELADWLMAALQAGQEAGGDKRGQQSAALLIVRDKAGYGSANDRYIDLRVEDHPEPIKELARLLEMHKKFYSTAHRNPPKQK